MKDGLTEKADRVLLAIAETLGNLDHDDARQIKFGQVSNMMSLKIRDLLNIFNHSIWPDGNIYVRAYNNQVSAWNELFDEQYED